MSERVNSGCTGVYVDEDRLAVGVVTALDALRIVGRHRRVPADSKSANAKQNLMVRQRHEAAAGISGGIGNAAQTFKGKARPRLEDVLPTWLDRIGPAPNLIGGCLYSCDAEPVTLFGWVPIVVRGQQTKFSLPEPLDQNVFDPELLLQNGVFVVGVVVELLKTEWDPP